MSFDIVESMSYDLALMGSAFCKKNKCMQALLLFFWQQKRR